MNNPRILNHFKQVDQIIYDQLQTMNIQPLVPITDSSKYFQHLCRNIIGQQLSGRVADVITTRFELLCPSGVTPKTVLGLSEIELRSVGLSNAKTKYVIDLAEKVAVGEVKLNGLDQLSDEEIIAELVKVKGIGRWTAEMFLIFTLGREDVFSFGDLGLKNAFKKLYQVDGEELKNKMTEITPRWSPYRSYGSLALWQSLDAI